MTATAMTGPRIAAPRTDTERQMSALLTARAHARNFWGWLRSAPRKAYDFFADTLNLRSAIESSRTVTDPLIAAAKRALGVLGPVETAALAASTSTGQAIVKATAGRALRWIGKGASWLYNSALWGISLFGRPGRKAALEIDSWVCDKIFQPVLKTYDENLPEIKKSLDPSSDGMRAIKGLAIWSMLRRVVYRFLPAPWNLVALIGGTVALSSRGANMIAEDPRTVPGQVVTETAAETVLVDGEPHTMMPVTGTATVTGPQGGTYEVPVTGVAVPAEAAEKLPETMADVVVTAEAAVPDGQVEDDVVAIVPNREAKRAAEKLEKKGGKAPASSRR